MAWKYKKIFHLNLNPNFKQLSVEPVKKSFMILMSQIIGILNNAYI